ncbi:hypothetical protein AGLY_001724 [Aphis glycines]|uniref:Uncharacterized protein n=1 Tax=Aphis glycines TaxID=307491 RepID=A0A6G0U4J4_APHGL|nr:hypothetical protein AGLY_001724 [Aphis glycines]
MALFVEINTHTHVNVCYDKLMSKIKSTVFSTKTYLFVVHQSDGPNNAIRTIGLMDRRYIAASCPQKYCHKPKLSEFYSDYVNASCLYRSCVLCSVSRRQHVQVLTLLLPFMAFLKRGLLKRIFAIPLASFSRSTDPLLSKYWNIIFFASVRHYYLFNENTILFFVHRKTSLNKSFTVLKLSTILGTSFFPSIYEIAIACAPSAHCVESRYLLKLKSISTVVLITCFAYDNFDFRIFEEKCMENLVPNFQNLVIKEKNFMIFQLQNNLQIFAFSTDFLLDDLEC